MIQMEKAERILMDKWRVKQLSIRGFRSFGKEQTFYLDDLPRGFYLISGENKVEEDLGSNGAGKSTLWEALCWVLYGKTSTNLKAGTVKNWVGSEKCRVEVELQKGDDTHLISRTWNPNSLSISTNGLRLTTITQDELETLIGMDFKSFLHSVFISQFVSKFFDLSPAEKLVSISDTLDLDKWLVYSSEAKKKHQEVQGTIISKESELSRLEGQIDSLMHQKYDELSREWEDKRKVKIVSLNKDLDSLEIEKKGLDSKISVLEKKLVSNDDQYKKVSDQYEKQKEEEKKIQIELSDIKSDIRALDVQLRQIDSESDKFKDVEDSCPYCYQKVTPEYLKGQIDEIQKDHDKVSVELRKFQKKHEEKDRDLVKIQEALRSSEDWLDLADSSKREIELDLQGLESSKQGLLRAGDDIKDNLEELRGENNPYLELKKENENKISSLVQQAEGVRKEVKSLRSDVEVYKYWEKGFKDIRFLVVSEVLREFELYVNNHLEALGMSQWEILFSVDSETKAGDVRRGFSVLVKSPVCKDLVPFDCWSGGEGQRLRLAGTLGLISLISSRSGVDWDIEVFDEPTAWMSAEGIENLLELLRHRSVDSGKKIFIIDHRDFSSRGVFDGEVKVCKDEEGSKILV